MASTRSRGMRRIGLAFTCSAVLVLTACGGGEEAAPAPQVTVTVTAEPEPTPDPEPEVTVESTPEPTPEVVEEVTAPSSSNQESLAVQLISKDDVMRAGKMPKGPFDEQTDYLEGPLAYTVYDTVQPANCTKMVTGPYGGVTPDPSGPITGSIQRTFYEGDPTTYPGSPVFILETIQEFTSEDAANEAWTSIASVSERCKKYSYDDGEGPIDRNWQFTGWFLDNAPVPIFANTISMTDARQWRIIGLDANRIWAMSILTGRALDAAEEERVRDLVTAAKTRIQGGLG
jgi:hypothetical protein